MAFPTGWSTYWQATPINPIETLSGFLAYIELSNLSGLGGIANSSGADIRVSDADNNQLPCDVMPWYNNGTGILYLNITKTTGSQPVRVWAGNTGAIFEDTTGTYGQYATYNSSIIAFYASGSNEDRTSNQRHLNIGLTGSPTYGVGRNANHRSAIHNGVTNILTRTFAISTFGDTYVAIAATYSTGVSQVVFTAQESSAHRTELRFGSNNRIQCFVDGAGGGAVTVNTSSGFVSGQYVHAAVQSISATGRRAFIDGGSSGFSATTQTPNTPQSISIGGYSDNGVSPSTYFSGVIQSVHLNTNLLSTRYLTYEAQLQDNSSFWGTWTQYSNSEGGGSSGGYQEITGYSDTITYSYVGSCVYSNVPGMVGYWPLQDTAAGTVVSGIGCPNGIATGANPPSSVTVDILGMTGLGPGGLIPRSLFFNGHPGFGNGGTGQYIVLPITGSNGSGYLRNVDTFSYSIWAKYIQDDANNFIIVASPSGGSTKRASLELGSHPAPYSSNQRFESQISTTDTTDIEFDSPVSPLSSGVWYNLVVTANFNTKTVNHYLNGELVLIETGNFGSAFVNRNLSGFRLATAGVPGDINDNKFNGYLADFRLYHRELTETEARKLYRYGVDECIVGITQSLNINSPVYTTSNNRASLIKSATSESITNTRAEARAYLDRILSSISNTTTLSDGTLDETDSVISIASIVNVVTDSYGISSVIRLASSESNTSTSSLSTAQIQTLLSAIANIYTLANGELDNEDIILIEGISRVLTSASATCSIIMPLTVESNTKIDSSALGQVIAELRTSIEVKTGLFGAVLKDIGLVSTSNTNTSFNGSVSLELSAESIVRVLTSMAGTATIEVEIEDNIICLTVYVTMNDAQNPLYINQSRIVELSNSRSILSNG